MGLYRDRKSLKSGSHATQTCEPRQVREEATVNRILRAPWECLVRVVRRDMLSCQCRPEVRGLFFMNRLLLLIVAVSLQ